MSKSIRRNNRLQSALARRFVRLLSGSDDGNPPWLAAVSATDEPGLYLPSDAPWIVHADFATLIGGIRALLLQALHPGSLQGVMDHSRYQSDPLDRLAGTIRWLTVTTFGPVTSTTREADRVNRLHKSVSGNYQTSTGESAGYRAADPHLLLWVHIAFMDSFLRAHQNYSRAEIPRGADSYVALWSKSVAPLGLAKAPMTEAELIATLDDFHDELIVSEKTIEVVKWIKNPPLPTLAKPFYRLFYASAVASLPKEYRSMLNERERSLRILRFVTTRVLRIMRIAIGHESPIEDAAVARLHRAGVLA